MFQHPDEKRTPKKGLSGTTIIRIFIYALVIVAVGLWALQKWWWNPHRAPEKPAPETAAATSPSGTPARPPGIEPGDIEFNTLTMKAVRHVDNASAKTASAPVHTSALAPAPPVDFENATTPADIPGLSSVKDEAPIGEIERGPLYGLLWEAQTRFPADDLFMKRAPKVSVAELMAHPEQYRGKPVLVHGDVYRHERSVLPSNPSGILAVMEGEITTDNGFCCFFWTRLPREDFSNGVEVEIHGLFMKVVTFTDENGREFRAPLVVASGPTLPAQRKSDSDDATNFLSWMIQILVLLFLLYFVMAFFRRRALNRATEARRRARERIDRLKEEARAEEEAASGDPGAPKVL